MNWVWLWRICLEKEGRRWSGSRFAVTAGWEFPVLVFLLMESLRGNLMSQRNKSGYNFGLEIIFLMFISYIYLQLFLCTPTVLQLHSLILSPWAPTGVGERKRHSHLIAWYNNFLSTWENCFILAEWKKLNQTGLVQLGKFSCLIITNKFLYFF